MKYLKKIIIKNFQSHKNSIIDFSPGLNIIVGPSDSGKSAVIRAIKWALYNEPAGDYFIREGEKEASVTLEFSNNIKIKRLRSKSKNVYVICQDDNELVFEGFGNKVPQEIIDLIGIEKIPLDTNESNAINLGEQLEGAFLLSEKSSTRASAIGRLVGVDLIDDALKDTLKDLRNISMEKKTISESIKNTEDELITFNYLDDLKNSISQLEEVSNNIRKKYKIKTNYLIILNNYKKIYEYKASLDLTLNNLGDIDLIEKTVFQLENKNKDLKLYINLNLRLKEYKSGLSYNRDLLEKLINNEVIENSVDLIKKNIVKLQKLKNICSKLNYYQTEIKKTSKNIERLKEVNIVENKINLVNINLEKYEKLKKAKKDITFLYKSIKIGEEYLNKLQYLGNIDRLAREITILTGKLEKIINSTNTLNKIRVELDDYINLLNESKDNIYINLEKYQILLKQNDTCPFCLSIITEDKIDHIIKHYT
nr:AAA family ATPase [Tissierella sp.]